MTVKILGINGSHRRGKRNTVYMLEAALQAAEKEGDVETEMVHLYDKEIKYCVHCDACVGNYKKAAREEKLGFYSKDRKRHPGHALHGCVIKDDMQEVLEKIEEAQGVIFGTPVYILGMTSRLKALIDRMRYMVHHNCLRWTVGAAISQAYYPLGGQETTLADLIFAMRALNMIVVGTGLGATGISGPFFVGGPTPWEDDGEIAAVAKDEKWALKTSKWTGMAVAQVAKVVQRGLANTPKEEFENYWPQPHVG
jgi:multimeric flavodoxin WrbA